MNCELFDEVERCTERSMTPCGFVHGRLCRCAKDADHDGQHYCDMCGAAFVPVPPTGPPSQPFDKEDLKKDAFIRWALTNEGSFSLRAMKEKAVTLANEGRVAVNSLSEWLRNRYHVHHPNDWRPLFADVLVFIEPLLEKVIQRKTRKKPPLTSAELKLIGDGL